MTYRSLLVFLDQGRRTDARIAYALALARKLECHVVGAAPTGLFSLPAAISVDAPASTLTEFTEIAWNAMRGSSEQALTRFDSACRRAGIASFEKVAEDADKAASMVRLAHCSDIVVMSQADPAEPGFAESQRLVEDIVLRGARPTLVLPYAGQFPNVASRVLVAWDDSREAARAVRDALPLLRMAEQVQVVSWRERDGSDGAALSDRLHAVHRWLLWQGVSAETRLEVREIGISEAMLSHAADVGADLIVMGGYGHARWTERMLGGATRGLLASMTVPVLLSH